MKTIHYIVVAIVVICGLAAGVLFFPRSAEIALIRFKDKDFDAARAAFEKRIAAGELHVSVVMPLTQLYLQYGEVNSAIELMERYLARHPADQTATQLLGKFYQYAQRSYEYRLNLEKVVNESPTESGLRELSDIYNFTAQFDKQIQTLEKLVTLFPQRHTDFLDLANLQASQGRFADAVRSLVLFESQHPQRVNPDTVQLLISLQLDAGMAKAAAERAARWLRQHPNPEIAARFGGLLHFKGHTAEAIAVIQPFERYAEQSPSLLAELVQLEIKSGRKDVALRRLMRLFDERRLPSEVVEPLIDLLLTKGDLGSAIEVAQSADLSQQPDWLLANLADAALIGRQENFVTWMAATAGERFLETFPLIGAQLALARGDQAGFLRWVAKAETADLSAPDRLKLSSLYLTIGRRNEAIDLLRKLAVRGELPPSGFSDLAYQYIGTGKAAEGAALFDRIRRERTSSEVQLAWALVAAAAGRETDVLDWLQLASVGAGPVLRADFVTDLYHIAEDHQERDLALQAAQLLYARTSDRSNRYRVARALFNAERFQEAVEHAKAFMAATPTDEEESLYIEALSAGHRRGEPFGNELRAYWSRKLSQSKLPADRREEIIYALLDLDASEAALPALRELAVQRGGQWVFAYAEAAKKAGRQDELTTFLTDQLSLPFADLRAKEPLLHLLIENGGELPALPFLKQFAESFAQEWVFAYETALTKTNRPQELLRFRLARAARPGIEPGEKIEIASQVLELAQKEAAESILLGLAENSPPDSPEVSQLLFLWGPRPPRHAIDWLERRARLEQGPRQASWLEHLLNAAARQQVVSIAASALARKDDERVRELYLQALAASSDKAALAFALNEEIQKRTDPETMRRRARLALETGLPEIAGAAFTKLLEKSPGDREALKWLGALTFAWGRPSQARQHLQQYFDAKGEDFESHFYLGELLLRDGASAAARLHFERSAQLIESMTTRDAVARSIHAQTLDRLGRTPEALAELDSAVKQWPGNKQLRADFVSVLLRAKKYAEAEKALSTP